MMRTTNIHPQYIVQQPRMLENYYLGNNSLSRKMTPQNTVPHSPARTPNQSLTISRDQFPKNQRYQPHLDPYFPKASNVVHNNSQNTNISNTNRAYRGQNYFSVDKNYSNKNSPRSEQPEQIDSRIKNTNKGCIDCSKKLTTIQLKISFLETNITNLSNQLTKIKSEEKPSSKETDNSQNQSQDEIKSLFYGFEDKNSIKNQVQKLRKEMNELLGGKMRIEGEQRELKNVRVTIKDAVNELKANLYQQMLDLETKINKIRKSDMNSFEEEISNIQTQIKTLNNKSQNVLLGENNKFQYVQKNPAFFQTPNHSSFLQLFLQLQHTNTLYIKNVTNPQRSKTLEHSQSKYYIDENGYLLDDSKNYIINRENKMIKLSQGQMRMLKKQGIMNW